MGVHVLCVSMYMSMYVQVDLTDNYLTTVQVSWIIGKLHITGIALRHVEVHCLDAGDVFRIM